MKKIFLLASLFFAIQLNAQTITVVKDQVMQGKKVLFKIEKLGLGSASAYSIKNMHDEELVSITPITEKAKNGTTQYMVSFANGELGIASNTAIVKTVLANDLVKSKAIIAGLLNDDGVKKYAKDKLKAFKEEPIAKDAEPVEIVEPKEKPKVVSTNTKPKEEPKVADVPKVVEPPMPEPVGNIEDRDISAPIVIRGKVIYQDNFIIAYFAQKTETASGKKLNKVQFKNFKGKFVGEFIYAAGQTEGRLYNSITKERTDVEILEDAESSNVIKDMAEQLLDLELL